MLRHPSATGQELPLTSPAAAPATAAGPGLEVRLFGEISVLDGNRPMAFPSAKALELLCYLLIHADRPHTRESLSEVLWPAAQASASKGYLRQALWRLSRTLAGPPAARRPAGELLLIGPDWVRVDAEADWWLDVTAIEATYRRVRDVPGGQLTAREAADLEAAVALHRGELMATWYHDWCSYQRDRQHQILLGMLDQLTSFCEVHRRFAAGLEYGHRILQYDPAREDAHRQVMRLYYGAGDRTSAMRQYQRCAQVLRTEFGIAPAADTVLLYEQIRADAPLDALRVGVPAPRRADETVAGLHARLDQIQAGLTALHDVVHRHVGQHDDGAVAEPGPPPEVLR
jgi:DNA-binding SARP family transcriptional activator